mmetsp:Transcript_10648/g.24223  ORF Transcript_10648/g.24223 Transcript_10648/m.24223 type:complete len:215 (+) Transcript_10648:128-772(+)
MWSSTPAKGSTQAGGSSGSRSRAETASGPTSSRSQEVREEQNDVSAVDMMCKNRLTLACCSGTADGPDDSDEHLQLEFASLSEAKMATVSERAEGPSERPSQRPASSTASSSRWWTNLRQHLVGWTAMCGNGLPTGVDQSCEAIEAEHPALRDNNPWRKTTVNGRDCMLCGTHPMHDCSDEDVVKKEMILVKAKGTLRDGEQVFTDGDDMRQRF